MRSLVIPPTLLALALLLTTWAGHAKPPINYAGWSVTNVAGSAVIDTSASCDGVIVVCKTTAQDDGFIQEEIKVGGKSYFRVILTENNEATGLPKDVSFFNEDYVSTSSSSIDKGVAARQLFRDTSQGYEDSSEIQRGFAKLNDAGTPVDQFNIQMVQAIDGVGFSRTFSYTNYTALDDSAVIGEILDISQLMPTDTGGMVDPENLNSAQIFEQRMREGVMGITSINCADPFNEDCDLITTGGNMTLGSQNVSWNAEEAIASTWLASNTQDKFSFQNIDNKDTGAHAEQWAMDTIFNNLSEPIDPFAWDADLGPAPASFPPP